MTRWLVAAAFGASSAAIVYAGLRAGQTIIWPGEDPALASWSVHAAFTWRALIALYAGGILAFVVRPFVTPRSIRFLPAFTVIAGCAIMLQALFAP